MDSEYKNIRWGDFAQFKYGKMPDKKHLSTNITDFPVFSGYRIVGYYDEYNVNENELVIVARGVGGTGDVKLTKSKCYLTNLSIVAVTDESVALKKYLYYFFMLSNLRYLDSGSAQSQITISDLQNVMIPLPSIRKQQYVVDVLTCLDNKIENNNKINHHLEQMAQAIFKSWFVDFEPFGGVMPSDWREGTLGESLVCIESGARPKGGAEFSGIPSIGAENIERFGCYNYSKEKYISCEFFKRLNRGIVHSGDVLLYKDGAYTGKVSMALDGFPHTKCAINEHVFILRMNSVFPSQFFLYLFLSLEESREKLFTMASSKAAQPGLNQAEVKTLKVILPSSNLIKDFDATVSPLMHLIACLANENRRLASLRDTLLPRLMSGELSVSELSDLSDGK